ncbi:MAG TPA: hypothetical protein VFM77_03260 [Terriglobales bacterium]|nr:hypothetical protein [Terriglobales bacterium]
MTGDFVDELGMLEHPIEKTQQLNAKVSASRNPFNFNFLLG